MITAGQGNSFFDALAGADGTGDPAPVRFSGAQFGDALAEAFDLPPVSLDRSEMVIPVPAVALVQASPAPSRAPARAMAPARPPVSVPAPAYQPPPAYQPVLYSTAPGHGPAALPVSGRIAETIRQAAQQAQQARHPGQPAGPFTPPWQVPAAPHPAAHQRPAPAPRPPQARPRKKKGGGVTGFIVFLLIILFASGLGQRLIEALQELLNK